MIRIRKQWAHPLGLLLSLLPLSTVGAHVGGRVYPIYELTGAMLPTIQYNDASVEEWSELIGEPSMTLLDFRDDSGLQGSPDPSDLDFKIWLAWHNDPARFYLAFVSSDDVYVNNHDYDVDWFGSYGRDDILNGSNDSIGLAIDGDHSGGEGVFIGMTQEEVNEINGGTQQYDAIAQNGGGVILDDYGVRQATGEFAWTIFPPYGTAGGGVFGEAPFISVIEMDVTPFDRRGWYRGEEKVVSDLETGQVIGFGIVVIDNDENDQLRIWVPEAMVSDKWGSFFDIREVRADNFIDGILLPTQPQGSAVGGISWGRIKASLEFK